jgi:hypothetical protein
MLHGKCLLLCVRWLKLFEAILKVTDFFYLPDQ